MEMSNEAVSANYMTRLKKLKNGSKLYEDKNFKNKKSILKIFIFGFLFVSILAIYSYQNSQIEHLKNIIELQKQFLSTKKDKESIAQRLLLNNLE